MDSATLIAERADQVRFIMLAINLAIFVPLSLYEIGYLQRFKVDRLFLYTCMLYTTCFSLRLINSAFFENLKDPSNFEYYFLEPFL